MVITLVLNYDLVFFSRNKPPYIKNTETGVFKDFEVCAMNIDPDFIQEIRNEFTHLRGKPDLVKLINKVQRRVYGKDHQPILLKSLNYYANPAFCKQRYETFSIKKKSGGTRTIHAPVTGLKYILYSLNVILQSVYEPHKAVTGFVPNKSIVDNAKPHVGKPFVYNIDLKDFFHSFDRNWIKLGFMTPPFDLKGNRESLAFLLASLCTHPLTIGEEIKTVLPQGSPTSPTISNILCANLDQRLNGLAKKFGATYTRYADDITFSSEGKVYQPDFFKELERIIQGQGLNINPQKNRLQNSAYRQEVTGLIVNEKVNVRRRYIKQLRLWLYYWERYGIAKAQKIFEKDYQKDKGHVKPGRTPIEKVMEGKLNFLKMVKGEEDSTYLKLNNKYKKLLKKGGPHLPKTIKQPKAISPPPSEKKQVKSIKSGKYKHNPQVVLSILQLFSQGVDAEGNINAIKYSTHGWGNGLFETYDDFIKRVNNEYVKIVNLQNYQYDLYWDKVYPFLLQKRLTRLERNNKKKYGWGRYKIKMGWQYPNQVMLWFAENFDATGGNLHSVFDMDVSGIVNSAKQPPGITIQTFGDVVQLFKKEIEFRDYDFLVGIQLALGRIIPGYDILLDKKALKGVSFYTNTEDVLKAIEIILRMIKSRPSSKKVSISYSPDPKTRAPTLAITHLNSFSNQLLSSPKLKLERESGDLSNLRKTLISLCDFSVESRFKDENNEEVYRKIEYLYEGVDQNNWVPRIIPIDNDAPEGFKFVLKFPVL